jgi:hypothetical protein
VILAEHLVEPLWPVAAIERLVGGHRGDATGGRDPRERPIHAAGRRQLARGLGRASRRRARSTGPGDPGQHARDARCP